MKGIVALLFSVIALANSAATNTYVSQAQDICSAKGSDDTLVEHEECTKFYICSKGEPIAISCASINNVNLYYNDDIKSCDWPTNVDCGSRDVKEPFIATSSSEEEPKDIVIPREEDYVRSINDDPSKAAEICAAKGSDNKFVAHEECNKFYACYEGIPVANKCANNIVLYYDPKLNACNWPENVDCGSRIVDKEANKNAVDVQVNVAEYAAKDRRS